MTVIEHIAYLKGLFEGLDIDTDKKEGKLLAGMLSAMEELAATVTDLKQQNRELIDELDDIYEEISAVTEDFLLNDADENDDLESEGDFYQVICPTCGEIFYPSRSMLDAESFVCGACGEELEFDLSGLDISEEE